MGRTLMHTTKKNSSHKSAVSLIQQASLTLLHSMVTVHASETIATTSPMGDQQV
jgi:hypothetical protein